MQNDFERHLVFLKLKLKRSIVQALLTINCLAFFPPPVQAQTQTQQTHLGEVHFPTSCSPEVQARFDSGVALLHSFEFQDAENIFQEVEKDDPKCVIAAWALALSQTERAGANSSQKILANGWKQLQPWLSVNAGTEREQMYVDAVRSMYENYDTVSGEQRWNRYLSRMNALHLKYPKDINASLFYGLGLVLTAGPGKEGLVQRQKALAIFLPIFKKYPENPGAAHYIIHAADTAELASKALPAARKYASIAPDSPHAEHMPSHIFNRLGLWQDSIKSNQRSAQTASNLILQGKNGQFDQFHALNNLEYGYLQLGKDAKAQSVVQQIHDLVAKENYDIWAPIDARIYYDLETHNWADALNINPPKDSPFAENFDVYWIRCIAAARLMKPQEAELALADFRKSSELFIPEHGWQDVLHLALVEAEAWTSYSQGQTLLAFNRLKDAEQFERDHPLYYADVLPRPVPEMLGDMLLQTNKPAEALIAYQQALTLAPNRFNSLQGAKAAAKHAGNSGLSTHYSKKMKDFGMVDASRP